MENLYLIVGLGNPGADYARTRHNAGFLVVEHLARRWDVRWRNEQRFLARVARAQLKGRKVLLAQPQTFMNSSGEAVAALVGFYRVSGSQMLVIVDDADLPLGELRLRPAGGPGGHHGLESIEQRLGIRDYPRLRVGIGRHAGAREISGHVLGRFDSTEMSVADKVLGFAADQAELWLVDGIQKAMNKFNGVVADSETESEAE
jgi:PTH1 family peptidyl-tRNA hydrolase